MRPSLSPRALPLLSRSSCVRSQLRYYAAPPAKGKDTAPVAQSSCAPGTVLTGMSYLKDQPPVLSLPDEEYPAWLWGLLKSKAVPEDGPGGKGDKMRLKKERQQAIKDSNFLKTQ